MSFPNKVNVLGGISRSCITLNRQYKTGLEHNTVKLWLMPCMRRISELLGRMTPLKSTVAPFVLHAYSSSISVPFSMWYLKGADDMVVMVFIYLWYLVFTGVKCLDGVCIIRLIVHGLHDIAKGRSAQ